MKSGPVGRGALWGFLLALLAFAGLYVLITATLGVGLMKESKTLGRLVFRPPKLAEGS